MVPLVVVLMVVVMVDFKELRVKVIKGHASRHLLDGVRPPAPGYCSKAPSL